MNLLNEMLKSRLSKEAVVKAMPMFAIVNQLGEMVNPTDYGYEVGCDKDWVWSVDELDNAVDLICWMSEKWNMEFYVVPCANIGEKLY